MFEANKWIDKVHTLDHGTPRMDVMKNAIQEADEESQAYWGMYFRYEYIKESCFYDDNFKAIIMFPELLQLFDEHPELEDEMYHDVMWAYKWIIDNINDYYQISRENIEQYFADYRKRCEKYGFSLRVYYMKLSRYLLKIDKAEAKEAYKMFHLSRRDGNCDCEACEINYDMQMSLEFGNEEEGLKIAEPVLSGKKYCGEIPHTTYGTLTRYYLFQGNLEKAAYYGRLCERYTANEQEFLKESGYLLELYSVLRPDIGWKIFRENIQNFITSKNPLMRLGFAKGAYRLMQQIEKDTEYCTNSMLSLLPVNRTEEGFKSSEIREYFYQFALDYSMRLDQRNGSSYYMDRFRQELPKAETVNGVKDVISYADYGFAERALYTVVGYPAGEMPSLQEMQQKIKSLDCEDFHIQTTQIQQDRVLKVTFQKDKQTYDMVMISTDQSIPFSSRKSNTMNPEVYTMLQTIGQKLVVQMDFHEDTMLSFHLLLKMLYTAMPNLLGMENIVTGKAYDGNWVKLMATYPEAPSHHDIVDLTVYGTDESDEIWLSTRGLNCLGLRELELLGANKENFSYFADILYNTAVIVAERGMLPQAGERFHMFRDEENAAYYLTWQTPHSVLGDGRFPIAESAERIENASAILMLSANSLQHPTEDISLLKMTEINFPTTRTEFLHRIYLAKATYSMFEEALKHPFQMAAVRMEFQLDEEAEDEAGYSQELLWAEICEVSENGIIAVLQEESEYLPQLHEGDRVKLTPEAVTAWVIQPENADYTITEMYAYLLY